MTTDDDFEGINSVSVVDNDVVADVVVLLVVVVVVVNVVVNVVLDFVKKCGQYFILFDWARSFRSTEVFHFTHGHMSTAV